MSNKLALLALIPLMSFMLVPLATAASTPSIPTGVWVYGYVQCESNSGSGVSSGASLTYAGHTINILCHQGGIGSKDLNHGYGLFITGEARYTATVFAGGQHYTEKGTFGINDCGSSLYGKQDAVKSGVEVAYGSFDLNACVEFS